MLQYADVQNPIKLLNGRFPLSTQIYTSYEVMDKRAETAGTCPNEKHQQNLFTLLPYQE